MKLALTLLPMALAGSLTFGRNGASKIVNTATGDMAITAPNCIDRSNWCVPYMSTSCVTDASATKVTATKFNKGGNSAGIILFSDGTLRFKSIDGSCIGVTPSAPTADEVSATTAAALGQLNFHDANDASVARIHLDASSKMWIQAAQVLENGVVISPVYPTASPTKAPTPTKYDFTFKTGTWCGVSDGMIATKAECVVAAKAAKLGFVSDAGAEWHAGCIINQGGVYYSPLTQGGAHSKAVDGGYLCKSKKQAQHQNTWCGEYDGMVATEADCMGAAHSAGMTYAAQAGNTWHAGCIIHGGAVYYSPLTRDGTHSTAVDGGYLCIVK